MAQGQAAWLRVLSLLIAALVCLGGCAGGPHPEPPEMLHGPGPDGGIPAAGSGGMGTTAGNSGSGSGGTTAGSGGTSGGSGGIGAGTGGSSSVQDGGSAGCDRDTDDADAGTTCTLDGGDDDAGALH